MTRRIYMDNAATSFPKPPAVTQAMTDYATKLGASPGRGAYAEAQESGRLMNACRQRINTLINGENPDHVVFTLNTSDALNLGIRGMLRPGDHVITTHLDHNSILRPLNRMAAEGTIEQTRLPVDPVTGLVDPEDIRKAVQKNTRLVAILHGSNVTGTLQPIRAIGALCRELAVPLLVDAAQSLGHVPVDVQTDNIDLLAFPGHKGLLGPLGTGGLYIRPGLEKTLRTVREGGTGSVSELDTQPDFMPDKYEPGSHNAIGLIGLSEGVHWILDQTVDKLWNHQVELMQTMIEGLAAAQEHGVHLFGPPGVANRCGVFSIRIDGYEDPNQLSQTLEDRYGILTRSGIHCAPLAHQTINTRDRGGTTRFSFGPYTTLQDVKYACDAVFELAESATPVSA